MKGLLITVHKALPLFKDGGSIILNSSVSNVMGLPAFSAYAAIKAAVRSFSRSWTHEMKDRNIRVKTLSPGATETPMGRKSKPEEIAAAITFFASDESSYITGIDLAVDGGWAQVCPRINSSIGETL